MMGCFIGEYDQEWEFSPILILSHSLTLSLIALVADQEEKHKMRIEERGVVFAVAVNILCVCMCLLWWQPPMYSQPNLPKVSDPVYFGQGGISFSDTN